MTHYDLVAKQLDMGFEYKKDEHGHYLCGVCGETREKQNTMFYHLQKHEGKMSHTCGECKKQFYQKYALNNHMKLHHSTDPKNEGMKCPFNNCESKFQKKEHCRVHIARNHVRETIEKWIDKKEGSKIHTCNQCKNDFNSYPAILYHVMEHAKETTDITLKRILAVI